MPAAARATQRLDEVRRRVVRFIHHVDERRVRVALAEQTHPLFDFRCLLLLGQAREPRRRLPTPDKRVLFEREAVVSRVLHFGVETRPIHLVARGFDRRPLALVLGRQLIPIVRKIRSHLTTSRDVANEFL